MTINIKHKIIAEDLEIFDFIGLFVWRGSLKGTKIGQEGAILVVIFLIGEHLIIA